jgi:hypothetical protein
MFDTGSFLPLGQPWGFSECKIVESRCRDPRVWSIFTPYGHQVPSARSKPWATKWDEMPGTREQDIDHKDTNPSSGDEKLHGSRRSPCPMVGPLLCPFRAVVGPFCSQDVPLKLGKSLSFKSHTSKNFTCNSDS